MIDCKRCGETIPNGMSYCTSCGMPVTDTRPMQPEAHEANDVQSPMKAINVQAGAQPGRLSYQAAAQRQSRYGSEDGVYSNNHAAYAETVRQETAEPELEPAKVLGTGGYLGALILMGLPVIGLIITIVWACGGSGIQSKVKLARGYLLYVLIVTVVIVLILGILVVVYADTLSRYLNMLTKMI